MTTRPGSHPDELISAAVSGDLTDAERLELDTHLESCPTCRETLAAWTEQRRLISGVRHIPVPGDLGARVRTGIETGAFATPWWRRPGLLVGVGASLATVTAAVMAVVVFGNLPGGGVGSTTSPSPTGSLVASLEPSVSAEPSVAATPTASPSPPPAAGPDPDYLLAFAGPSDSLVLTLREADGTTRKELPTPGGPPLHAAVSPDGVWIAYITRVGEKGTNMLWAANVESGDAVELGESLADSPFLQGLFWSPDSRYLTYTIADWQGDAGTDAWLFDTSDQSVEQLTQLGDGYAASWRTLPNGESRPWVSGATFNDGAPASFELPADLEAVDKPIALGDAPAAPVFQPLWNRDGNAVIFWEGSMRAIPESGPHHFLFAQGGQPMIAPAGERWWNAAAALFSDVTVGLNGFESAAITWGNTDSYAVWNAAWTGTPQSSDGSYPDRNRVYFSHLSDPRNIQQGHALDLADIPQDCGGAPCYVSSVAISPADTDYLALTIGYPLPGDLAQPKAELRIIKRNTGTVADEIATTYAGPPEGWWGPAVYR